MSTSTILVRTLTDDDAWRDALQAAAAFLAGFRSSDTRKGYRRDLRCWLEFCAAQRLHPYSRPPKARAATTTRWCACSD